MSFSYIHGTGAASSGAVTSVTSPSISVVAGHLIVVGCLTNITTTHVVTDSQGNTYTLAVGYQWASLPTQRTSLFYAIAGSSGALTVTLTPSASAACVLSADEFSFAGSLALDRTSTGNDGGTLGLTLTAGTLTPTGTDLVVAVGNIGQNNATGIYPLAAGAGFTATYVQQGSADFNTKDQLTEYKLGVAGPVAPSMSASSGNPSNWGIVAAAFKEVSSGRLILSTFEGGFRDAMHGGFRL